MQLYDYEANTGLDNYRNTNEFSKWYVKGCDVDDKGGSLAVQRLKNEVFKPKPLFSLNKIAFRPFGKWRRLGGYPQTIHRSMGV